MIWELKETKHSLSDWWLTASLSQFCTFSNNFTQQCNIMFLDVFVSVDPCSVLGRSLELV